MKGLSHYCEHMKIRTQFKAQTVKEMENELLPSTKLRIQMLKAGREFQAGLSCQSWTKNLTDQCDKNWPPGKKYLTGTFSFQIGWSIPVLVGCYTFTVNSDCWETTVCDSVTCDRVSHSLNTPPPPRKTKETPNAPNFWFPSRFHQTPRQSARLPNIQSGDAWCHSYLTRPSWVRAFCQDVPADRQANREIDRWSAHRGTGRWFVDVGVEM